jgi:hypothetical protein
VSYYSWGMCTTSVKCKTVITTVLMVKSGMDPHMISRDIGCLGMVGLFGFQLELEYPG